jgi:hypothetical protein
MFKGSPRFSERADQPFVKSHNGIVRWFSSPLVKRKSLVLSVFLLFVFTSNFAQVTDTTARGTNLSTTSVIDSSKQVPAKPKPVFHSPKKAALMSTILPGLGQVYNKKYWKVPIIYVGFAGLAYSFSINQKNYSTYFNAYKVRLINGPGTLGNYPRYTDDNLNTLQLYYQRSRNLSVIGMALLYVLNIVDASVDAHLFTFNVDDDLSFDIHPTLINTAYANQYTSGFALNIRF